MIIGIDFERLIDDLMHKILDFNLNYATMITIQFLF